MTAVSVRKTAELTAKLASVRDELARWRGEAGDAGPLRLHHTQIERVTTVVDGLADVVDERLHSYADDEQRLLAGAIDVELMILELHRIWEFFRAKLALRYVDWFASHLAAADELAWRCYAPACELVPPDRLPAGGLKEPPLTCFNGGSSPWTVPRGRVFAAEDVPGEALRTAAFAVALQRLPVPVVGLPWHQVEHLPDALVIAHEAGHLVVEDLGLSPRLELAVASAGGEVWAGWAGEAIADVYGAHATGPAFGGALLDFLAADRWSLAQELEYEPSVYPPRGLRIALVVATLRRGGFAASADELWAAWCSLAGDFEFDDVAPVVEAILSTPHPELGGSALGDVSGFGHDEHDEAQAMASRALAERSLPARDPRVLVAAARLAFEHDPAGYGALRLGAKFRARILAARPEGTRRADDSEESPLAADRATGRALAELISVNGRLDVQAQ